MSDRIKWVERDGCKILFVDYSNLEENEYLEVIKESRKFILAYPADKPLPSIADVTNSYTTEKIKDAQLKMKDAISAHRKTHENDPTAVVGVTGMKRVIARIISGNIYYAKDMDDAVAWVVKEAKKLGVNSTGPS